MTNSNTVVTTSDQFVTASSMRELGMRFAYEHVAEFLKAEGGSATTKEIQNYVAKKALAETNISVHTFFRKDSWQAFRSGIHSVNPACWSQRATDTYGPPLPIFVGKEHTRGEWDLIEVGASSKLKVRQPILDGLARFFFKVLPLEAA